MTLTISALAESLGLSPDTLRYYERVGLLPRAERTASGYRLYDQDAVERLGFISAAKRMGLRLADIKNSSMYVTEDSAPAGTLKTLLSVGSPRSKRRSSS